ncbi:hypothetical protein ACOCJ7_09175 [Knoellia sp. CPCC 206453]|uniref:hypothetical protein n=1 Tax=Knoellia pratensis TaxID=3404796 RepID=UPI00360F903A
MRRLGSVATLGLLAACGSHTSASDTPQAVPSATADIRCGSLVLDQGELLEVAGAEEIACLESALRERRSAALTVTAPTVEGDPIVFGWRLTADGTLTSDIDSSRDSFGGEPRQTRLSCGRITQLPNPLSCAQSG